MRFEVKFNLSNQKLTSSFGNVQTVTKLVGDPYEGDYDVIPRATEQTLPTKEKLMLEDVSVKAIPTYEVSNTTGGTTFYIATMDE